MWLGHILVSGIYMYMCIHMYIYLVPNFSAAVRVGLIDGKFHLNPTAREVQFCYHILCGEYHKASFFQLDSSCLNLIVTTTEDNIGKLALSFVPRTFRRRGNEASCLSDIHVHVHYVFHLCHASFLPVMVEGVAHEVAEETFCDAILYAHQEVHMYRVYVLL